MKSLADYISKAIIQKGLITFSEEQHDELTHAYSYLGKAWQPKTYLTDEEFVVYDKFENDFFEVIF